MQIPPINPLKNIKSTKAALSRFNRPVHNATLSTVLSALILLNAHVWANPLAEEESATVENGGYYSESPMLAAKVAAGDLPPVDERLPNEPKERTPLQEVGTYGGTLTMFSTDPNPWQVLGGNPTGRPYPIRRYFDGTIEADLALDYKLADDYLSFTIFLREGQKWSNGDPFTAEDFVFYYNVVVEKELSFTWGASSNVASITALDDHTVHWEYNEPFPQVLSEMISYQGTDWGLFAPTEWLKQWHIEYNPKAQALAVEEGFESWQEAFDNRAEQCCSTGDLERPSVQPFIIVNIEDQVSIWERNPYYFAVDPVGQQLPYIDRLMMHELDLETYRSRVIGGEADFAANMSFADYPALIQNQESGGYEINLIESWFEGLDLGYMFNLNHADPVKHEFFNNIEARRALSLALDRDEISAAWLGELGVDQKARVPDIADSYQLQWGVEHPYLQYDPEEANRILDSFGLDKRNDDGTRLASNGEPLVLNIAYGEKTPIAGYELVKEYWENIGIGIKLRAVKWTMILQNRFDGALIAPYPLVYRSNLINVPYRIAPLVGGSISIHQYGDQYFFRD